MDFSTHIPETLYQSFTDGGLYLTLHVCWHPFSLNLSHPHTVTQKPRRHVEKTPVCVHLQTERQQRQQGLFGGASCELRQCLDQFVHHHAKVALQLFPSFFHKLGILQGEREKQSREGAKKLVTYKMGLKKLSNIVLRTYNTTKE